MVLLFPERVKLIKIHKVLTPKKVRPPSVMRFTYYYVTTELEPVAEGENQAVA